jgi:type II secretory pathway pseudopilin PulG
MTRRARSFVLLEVILSLMILSIVLTTLLRGFVIALGVIRETRIVSTATLLAESLLEDYELEPPLPGSRDGLFSDDPRFGSAFAAYRWERRVDEVSIRYARVPRNPLQEPEPLYRLELSIVYDDGRHRRFTPMRLTTYLLDTELFSDEALQENQLF